MRQWIAAVVMVAALVVPVSASSIWTLADSDSALLCVMFPVSENVEAGIESAWRHDSETPGHIWGLRGVYIHPEKVDFNEIFKFDWLPQLTANPYVGAFVTVDLEHDGDRTMAGPVAGLIVQDILVIEYAYQYVSDSLDDYLNDRYRLRVGLRIPW